MTRATPLLSCLLALPAWSRALADDCPGDAIASARASATIGDVASVKDLVARCPGDARLKTLLGVAYAHAGNPFWAVRTLRARLDEDPSDCAARAWLAWVHFRQAALDEARETLAGGFEACGEADRARLLALRALVADAEGRPGEAARDIVEARFATSVWPSDARALPALAERLFPDGVADLAWRVEVLGGYTSNALLGSPTDPASGSVTESESGLGQFDAWVRFAPAVARWWRPSLEVQGKGVGFAGTEVRGLSYLDLSGRVGVMVGRTLPRVLVGYRPDFLLLRQGDRYEAGPVWYYGAHRGEVEVEVAPWLLAFAGAGRRVFREAARTRTEADAGFGGRVAAHRRVAVLWAASGRVVRARESAWNLYGASGLAGAHVGLGAGFSARAGLTVAADFYPESSGYGPFGTPARDRRDVLVKPGLVAWSPPWHGLRAGVGYEFSRRRSTVSRYGFSDHRVALRLLWVGGHEFLGPREAPGKPLADLPWGAGDGEGAGVFERVQDLLRQDEAVQRSSSCVQ